MFFLLNKLFLPSRNPTNPSGWWLLVAHTVAGGIPVAVFALYSPTIHFVLVVRNMAALRAAVQTWWCILINDFLVNCMLYVVAAPLWDF